MLNAAPNYAQAVNIPHYGWMAVLFAVLEPKDTAVYKLIATKPGEAASEAASINRDSSSGSSVRG